MAKSKASNKEQKAKREVYRTDRAVQNRRKRLERHLKKHPEDQQAAKALAKPDLSVRSGRKPQQKRKTLHYVYTSNEKVSATKDKYKTHTMGTRMDRATQRACKIANKGWKIWSYLGNVPADKREKKYLELIAA